MSRLSSSPSPRQTPDISFSPLLSISHTLSIFISRPMQPSHNQSVSRSESLGPFVVPTDSLFHCNTRDPLRPHETTLLPLTPPFRPAVCRLSSTIDDTASPIAPPFPTSPLLPSSLVPPIYTDTHRHTQTHSDTQPHTYRPTESEGKRACARDHNVRQGSVDQSAFAKGLSLPSASIERRVPLVVVSVALRA